jgi:hypothetical protein
MVGRVQTPVGEHLMNVQGESTPAHQTFRRYEIKYYLPVTDIPMIRTLLLPYMQYDENCENLPDHRYTVRSIYFDTHDLRFYYEKMDSVKIRKKLRIRTYNLPGSALPSYFEIKRKNGRVSYKERIQVPLPKVEHLLNGKNTREVLPLASYHQQRLVEKIRYLMQQMDLQPVVLVTYEREALIGKDNEQNRATFDCNMRSLINPRIEQIFTEHELRQFEDRFFVLELKFDDLMPRWMGRLVRLMNLRPQPYSKYCQGIDAWRSHCQ